jgi:rubrerythrin
MKATRAELLSRVEAVSLDFKKLREQLRYDHFATDSFGWWTCACGSQTRNPECPKCGEPKKQ